MAWDPVPGAVKAVKDARRERDSARAAKRRAGVRWRQAREGYNENLRKAVEVLDEYTTMNTSEIAKALGINPSDVSNIRLGRR